VAVWPSRQCSIWTFVAGALRDHVAGVDAAAAAGPPGAPACTNRPCGVPADGDRPVLDQLVGDVHGEVDRNRGGASSAGTFTIRSSALTMPAVAVP